MALHSYRCEELNFFKFASLVMKEFPNALRETFKTMWDNTYGHCPGFQLWDDSNAVRNLFAATEGGRTKVPVHRSYHEWDCVALFQATIYSRTFAIHHRTLSDMYVKPCGLPHGHFHPSVVSTTGNNAETWALAIDQLRRLRNCLCILTNPEMTKVTFDQYVKLTKDAFQALAVSTALVDAVGSLSESEFPISEVRRLEQENMEDLRGASVPTPALGGDFRGPSRDIRQHEANLERQFREMREREENLQSQLSETQQREENLQRQLREMQQNLQRQLRETQQREENSQRQLSEMQQNSQRQLREMQQREENSQRQLREMQQREENLRRQLREKDQEVNELELSLSSAQQTISEQQQQETCDWVISRDEIQMTNKCLGWGAWGSVYEGVYCGCTVAVKQIHDLILSPHNIRLFKREMNIASKCRHPHLLQFIGATNDEGNPLFVTELMEKSLRALLEQRQLAETEIHVISLDVARAINYLHQKKPEPIIHRDVSSANVLLWQQGDRWRGKVSDYGTANFMQRTMTVAPGAMIYSPPEALTSNQTVKVDVYSFGVLLCEMCIRQQPDPRRREQQIVLMTNRALRGLVRRCLQTDPEARPTVQEIIDELSRTV